ncbi:MAG TPA: STAS domain-containing protein [Pyrinomonadaceae bacterium]|nr:STAS domain-containing protein [Pyrinomonadaceae bacterium]
MPTRITQLGDERQGGVVLRVEGKLVREDAELLERVCADITRQQPDSRVTLDLADLTFLDSESAAVLCRMRRQQNVVLDGLQFFVQRVVELADRAEALPRAV